MTTTTNTEAQRGQLVAALSAPQSSMRLRAALAAGSDADATVVEAIVARCGVEPDFFVRDMLTWALTRISKDIVVPLLVAELDSPVGQARSQALHSLSKIGDPGTWPAVAPLIGDTDDEVARSAWRAAVLLVPESEKGGLARSLAAQLGRGDESMRRSLSRALVTLGDIIRPVLASATRGGPQAVVEHVSETIRLLDDPDSGIADDIAVAQRIRAIG